MKKTFIFFLAVFFLASSAAFAQTKPAAVPPKPAVEKEAVKAVEKAPSGFPVTDVIKGAESYVIIAELPGVSSKDVSLEYIEGEKNYVELAGDKGEVALKIEGNKIQKERFVGKFSRKIDIADDILKDKISAEFNNNILVITLPIRKFQVKTSIKIGK